MAKKIKLTRPELKRQRDMLTRFQRYLPTLQLKQQLLQMQVREAQRNLEAARQIARQAQARVDAWQALRAELSGANLPALAEPAEVVADSVNIAGVRIPVLREVRFPEVTYSLFATPAWVDKALLDLRDLSRRRTEADILARRHALLDQELTKINQRVNLFEKVMIPESREAIRRIRIQLGDEMTAGVGRAKIAKRKLEETGTSGQEQYLPLEEQQEAAG
jgi:V/A-type H+-transporting ATPase subunit D